MMLKYHNQMRTDPKSMIPQLTELMKSYKGSLERIVKVGSTSVKVSSKEGETAVKELIDFLNEQPALQPLELSDELKELACVHVKDQGATVKVGHQTSAGMKFPARMEGYSKGKIDTIYGENLAYGTYEALDTILSLAIDDGVASRGHRKNIFKPDF